MCTASISKLHDAPSPSRAVRRNLNSDKDRGLLDPVGVYKDRQVADAEEQQRLGAIPFNTRFAFSEASTEADYQSYFNENIGGLIGQYYTGEGNAPTSGTYDPSQYSFSLEETDTEGVTTTRNFDKGSLEQGLREDFTALRNAETVKSSRERANSSKVLSNVARRRQARQQQTAADGGTSAGARKPFRASKDRGATLLTGEDQRRRTLLGGII